MLNLGRIKIQISEQTGEILYITDINYFNKKFTKRKIFFTVTLNFSRETWITTEVLAGRIPTSLFTLIH